MSFSLTPKDASASTFDCTNGFWWWLLVTSGAGAAINVHPHEFDEDRAVHEPDRDGRNPLRNDGYAVSEYQSKHMASAASVILRTKDDMTDNQKMMLGYFIEFASGSGGFEIH